MPAAFSFKVIIHKTLALIGILCVKNLRQIYENYQLYKRSCSGHPGYPQ